jgi:hypothetical protein
MTPTATQLFILIANQFDEMAVIACLSGLRERGVGVSLVGIVPGCLRGHYGILLCPDVCLTELEALPGDGRYGVLIPGRQENARLLWSDPRVHQLLERVLLGEGFVAALRPAQQLFVAGAMVGGNGRFVSHLLAQNDVELSEFIQQLIERIGDD